MRRLTHSDPNLDVHLSPSLHFAHRFYLLLDSITRFYDMDDKELAALPELSLEELGKYDGTDKSGLIYVGIDGRVFDVTSGKGFYGPGGK